MHPQTSGSRLPTLTSLRFLAALAVFVTHIAVARLFLDASISDGLARYLSRLGYAGVSFFFILSGFVLMWSTRPGDTPTAFYRRRLAKIYPNHVATWLAGLVLMAVTGATLTWGAALPSLFLLQSWSPDLTVLSGTNGPSWSLACELLFYLSFPLLAPILLRIPRRRLVASAAGITAVIVLIPVFAQLLPEQPLSPFQPVSWARNWFVYFLPLSRLPEFALGMVMARILRDGLWPGMPVRWALALVAGGYVLQVWLPDAYGLVAPTTAPLALLITAYAHRDVTGARTFLTRKELVWLGEVSFAFYMVHFLVLQYGPIGLATRASGDVARATPTAVTLILISLLVTLVAGALLHRFIEVPCMKRFGRSRTPQTSTTPGPAVAAATQEV
ncbi:peptidoglycan/LPS O-acetylase OafA/YrhL [Kineococcus xinjiangensis]|uniref:Peptidoglycan/LPS O-acetylase OafA/YrhL n=1 Tax=Kineococcus xinjiangensis TaxID=512762 RepID=A0A2S6IV23_9ACTN|nr:acyltransferase [Kineococcus xinjiangensis]PPK98058.1 peptidoglycan/LPS O-acetylase OafA/YrhL [Kineococcus xinjiangensis]